MAPSSRSDALAALAWLVEAGADETVGEAPVDRFAQKANPPLGGGSKNPQDFWGRTAEAARTTTVPASPSSPKFAAQISTLRQAEGGGDSIATAMEAAAASSTLAELRAALESFEGSQLKKNATNTVFADGNPQSRILFIGEAPGREEDRMGLPFVGRAGKLLDQMLAAIHLDRSKAYITNVLPWRPPDNRNPEATEVAQCIPFLRRHIELAGPGIMILLGAVSVRHVLGLGEGIMKFRGRWMEYRVGDRMVPVMPTLHPAYLLRQPAHKKLAWRDLQAVEEKITALGLNAR